MPDLVFPKYYRPRPYQAELHSCFRNNRIGIGVFSRQSGKDTAMSMENVDARLKYPKTTGVYVGTDIPSIRNILYDKTYWDDKAGLQVRMLQDNVPSDLVDWKDTRMEGRFSNKSVLKLEGYFQSGKDQNGVGTSFDDYSFTELSLFVRENPIPRLMPIIDSENGHKRLMVVATPRGKRNNPLWTLMELAKDRPDAQVLVRTIDDLNEIMTRNGLAPILTQAQLEQIAENYLKLFGNTRMFEQEYYCSFEEMDSAAVYGEAYAQIIKDKRATAFNWDRAHPIYVAFDIGSAGTHSDATCWIAFQYFNNKLFLIDCGEGHGRALPEYVDILQQKPWYNQLAQIVLPWDGDHHEVGIRETPADMMRKRFPSVAVLGKGTNIWTVKGLPSTGSADLITMVQQVRLMLYNTYINGLTDEEKAKGNTQRPNCDRVLDCFENYKYAYNTKLGEWSPFPVHDQYSHMMDALRYVVQAIKELNFFGGQLYDPSAPQASDSYVDDWKGVWA
ncbi:terminase [Microbacterium phage Moleficent]|uniref:Terminase n=6 Tax=Akonivirus TaxID=2842540 RepID=A0A6M3TBX0_9CAUD|nr:terminase [Microbacterium phage Phedro]QFG04975.1 terminase [Microbacterium phage PhriedRice]QJD52904.1 terminase [Microbacterium phage Phractured]QJD53014.1 terminase [Microbacterium phage Pharky]QNL30355.1 terminase [Microbacterium phage Mazun]QWY82744.1 terminase [Microbacterium phage StagePhright]UXE04141.1 terminase [Microbacterium phage Fullmetal]WNM74557.1 terminase [Microbacterium phage Moleficent]